MSAAPPGTYRTAPDVFACERFAADVTAYAKRHNTSRSEVARLCGCANSSLIEVLRGVRSPTLYQAVQLAKYADLSLDSYIRPGHR